MAAADKSVWTNLQKARRMLHRADAELRELAAATEYLHEPCAASRCEEDVARRYTNWLVDGRQVAVSVNAAGRAAGSPVEFASWWDGLTADPIHRFFRDQRNRALKQVADVIVSKLGSRPAVAGMGETIMDGGSEARTLGLAVRGWRAARASRTRRSVDLQSARLRSPRGRLVAIARALDRNPNR